MLLDLFFDTECIIKKSKENWMRKTMILFELKYLELLFSQGFGVAAAYWNTSQTWFTAFLIFTWAC